MAAVCQKVRTKNARQQQAQKAKVTQEAWSKLFPSKVNTETQSLMYVKKFVTVAVSTLTFLRSMIDDEAYDDKSLGKVKVKILNGKCGNSQAKLLNKWLLGAFDAIERKYLKEMSLCVHEDPSAPEEVVEKYTFTFSYENGVPAFNMDKNGKAESNYMGNLMDTTRTIIRDVATITEGIDKLPDKASLTMLLAYYDHTPDDYEPEGFTASDIVEKPMPNWAYKKNFGSVETKHHKLSLRVDTRQVPIPESHIASNHFVQSQSELGSQQSQNLVDCVCQSFSLDQLMLKCSKCGLLQHGACYRILSKDEEPSQHFCVKCGNDDQPCTDKKMLKNVGNPNLAANCLLRRIVLKVRGNSDVDLMQVKDEMELEDDKFQNLKNVLEKFGLVDAKGDLVQENISTIGMRKLFGIKEKLKDDLLHKTESLNINDSRMSKRKVVEDSCDKTGDKNSIVGGASRFSKKFKKSRSEETQQY